jgi:hypothetical protein
VDRLSRARDAARRIHGQEQGAGMSVKKLGVLPLLCQDAFNTGRWDETIRLADEGLLLSGQVDYPFYTWYFRYEKALVAAARGDVASAVGTADAMTSQAASRGGGHMLAAAAHLQVLAALAEGDFESAFRHAEAISPAGSLARYVPHASRHASHCSSAEPQRWRPRTPTRRRRCSSGRCRFPAPTTGPSSGPG